MQVCCFSFCVNTASTAPVKDGQRFVSNDRSLGRHGGGLWLAQYYLPFEWVHVGGFKKAGQLCVLIALGGGLYFVSLAALGFRPHHFRRVENKQP